MSEKLKTTKFQIVETTENSQTISLSDGTRFTLPKNIFPEEKNDDGYYFITISTVSNQEAVSKELAENLLNELINAPTNSKE